MKTAYIIFIVISILLIGSCGIKTKYKEENVLRGTGWRLIAIVNNNHKEYVAEYQFFFKTNKR